MLAVEEKGPAGLQIGVWKDKKFGRRVEISTCTKILHVPKTRRRRGPLVIKEELRAERRNARSDWLFDSTST